MAEYLFVTGKLAADALEAALRRMELDFEYQVAVLNISVAALMNTDWIARHLPDSQGCRKVMIPGMCQGGLSVIQERVGVPVLRGPKDLRGLALFLGREPAGEDYGDYRLKILAEIADAYRMRWDDILAQAAYYRANGADVIDLGCPVEGGFPGVTQVVARLKAHGFTVSVDTFDPDTILGADAAGVDLVLSINSRNIALAPQLHCPVVVVPDLDQGLDSLERNVAQLAQWHVPYIVDPVLNPLNFGFTESLVRFFEVRRRYPDAQMLMGVGNLTELVDADSTGINALMAGVMAELNIDYVLTTEVISWAKGSVRELDIARRLMYYARRNHVLPKHIEDGLITTKDPPWDGYTEEQLRRMHAQIRDRNFRVFANGGQIYVFNNRLFVQGTDPYELFDQLGVVEPTHAFYLGRELQRAALALRLGKAYIQEEPLRWGYLSQNQGEPQPSQLEGSEAFSSRGG